VSDAAGGIGDVFATGARGGRRISIRGAVQGVGFRPWVQRFAREQGIGGRVVNDGLGVTIEAFGPEAGLEALLKRLSDAPPPAARVREVRWEPIAGEEAREFVIEPSRGAGERRPSIPPDLATCPDCLREIFDAGDRRCGYAFTSCTRCGPRFTITRDTPYDRSATTMAGFRMCPRCEREYRDAADRRLHAQANACAECGPRLRLLGPQGEELRGDALLEAAARLRRGDIVAVKGLGGFHLACDATSAAALRRLRQRKQRDVKPFAVMVADLEAAERLAQLAAGESTLLASVERPIVLVRRRPGSGLAAELAPGSPLLGLMLAYTPLHHLLLAAAGRPLVMTSGNLSGEPIVHRDAEALERLAAIADAFLVHDREIQNRCEDSVARVVAGSPVVLRRARGYVPRGLAVPRGFARPVLACGAQLNNTFCLAAGQTAYLAPHVGDLDSLESCRAFEEAVERLERFLAIRPGVIAHDLHPDYHSTSYALARAEPLKIGVQHHHAHVASAMAEHQLPGPVLGVAYDGTGYGGDGTSWGGELLLARYESFERLATFRPIRLAGGDRAIREVWRIALALLDDAFEGAPPLDAIPLFRRVAAREVAGVRRMIARGVNAPLAHGVGRYFDALGAIGLGRSASSYEGQVALEWNLTADVGERGRYPFAVEAGSARQLDLRPLVRAAVEDLRAGVSAAVVSGRFHNTLADATADLVRVAALQVGHLPVVLSGGCFQNALLAERVLERLRPDFDVRLHGEVPPGDGGIALGQALVADAKLRESSCA
jgi:hydrogenase maturation protein HypF